MSVFVLGALHWDVVVDAPRLPVLGETLAGSAVDYRFGGKGGNQAVAAARLGARVAMAGRVGEDAAGRAVLAALDRAGVDRSRVTGHMAATGMSVAITEAEGDYAAVIVPGANAANDGAVDLPPDVTCCLIQAEIPDHANISLADRLPPRATLILNAAPARPVPDVLMAQVDILVVNRGEAEVLSGLGDPSAAARLLRRSGPGTVIVTLGAGGCLVADADGDVRLPARADKVVSTHGAGDVFCGALAAELDRGVPLRAAVDFAQAAAGLHVSRGIEMRDRFTEPDVRARLERIG